MLSRKFLSRLVHLEESDSLVPLPDIYRHSKVFHFLINIREVLKACAATKKNGAGGGTIMIPWSYADGG